MDDIYKNTEEYNPNKKLKILIFSIKTINYMVADILSEKTSYNNK